ncbi:hypothetical protein SteCoe_34494 [Stentor coeruleus]|uniref:Uncharacterized protein n=1 Tax=Stentor coeruleus TaxID=5963 RepID=A0A1R2AUD5_9CILI|nr:hypothetical protein SteCoe_34494 [Stentor coeruleus]
MEKQGEISVHGNPDCVVKTFDGYCISTYNLDKDTGIKTGSIQKFANNSLISRLNFDCGILDFKSYESNFLACTSDGKLILTDCLSTKLTLSLTDQCLSYLSLSGNTAYSASLDGSIHIVDLPTQSYQSYKLNAYEIWYIEKFNDLICVPISIGKLLVKDSRNMETFKTLNLHESEICSILIDDTNIYTGSFDGTITQIDSRTWGKVSVLNIGGGVWRMLRKNSGFLTANMEEGFKYTTPTSQFTVSTQSLAYGLAEVEENLIIGCSFYDSKLVFMQTTTT